MASEGDAKLNVFSDPDPYSMVDDVTAHLPLDKFLMPKGCALPVWNTFILGWTITK